MHILIWNVMKIGEKQHTMLAKPQTQYSMLSATTSVCVCMMSDFRILRHFTRLVTGDIKIFVQNKTFSDRPTRLCEPYVTETKQLFCHEVKDSKIMHFDFAILSLSTINIFDIPIVVNSN